jgi:hypothetical protein
LKKLAVNNCPLTTFVAGWKKLLTTYGGAVISFRGSRLAVIIYTHTNKMTSFAIGFQIVQLIGPKKPCFFFFFFYFKKNILSEPEIGLT